MLRCVSFEK
jgi:hypothetical protein